MDRQNLKDIGVAFCVICLLWWAISLLIQSFMCPEMTQTEVILSTPTSFIAEFKSCEG